MASVLFQLGCSIQLSAQVSECLAFDLSFLPFIQSCLSRHQVGDFEGLSGLALEHAQELAAGGYSVSSVFEFTQSSSCLQGMQLQLVSPVSRDTTFISFIGEH